MARSRFKIPREYGMRVMHGKEPLLAFFNFIDTELGLEFTDWRLIDGQNGVFVASPSREYTNKAGEKKYTNYIYAASQGKDEDGRAWLDELAEVAEEVWEKLSEEEEEEKPRKRAKAGKPVTKAKKAKASTKSRRARDLDEDDPDPEDDELDDDDDELEADGRGRLPF